MKKLLIFILPIILSLAIELRPINLNDYQTKTIEVTVNGEVKNPGAYELPLYASYQDLLDRIEVSDKADLSKINPNIILKDKDIVNIPTISEKVLVSINTASLQELCTLPGIGESTAQKIIDYRNEQGLFQTLEDLTNVSGIGQAKLDKIYDLICL